MMFLAFVAASLMVLSVLAFAAATCWAEFLFAVATLVAPVLCTALDTWPAAGSAMMSIVTMKACDEVLAAKSAANASSRRPKVVFMGTPGSAWTKVGGGSLRGDEDDGRVHRRRLRCRGRCIG